MNNKFGFQDKLKAIERELKDMNNELANITVQHFVSNFDSRSFDGNPWPDGGKDYNGLDETGEMKSAVENPRIETTNKGFGIEVENDYFIFHNDGTDKIPMRKSVGQDAKLTEIQTKFIGEELIKILK